MDLGKLTLSDLQKFEHALFTTERPDLPVKIIGAYIVADFVDQKLGRRYYGCHDHIPNELWFDDKTYGRLFVAGDKRIGLAYSLSGILNELDEVLNITGGADPDNPEQVFAYWNINRLSTLTGVVIRVLPVYVMKEEDARSIKIVPSNIRLSALKEQLLAAARGEIKVPDNASHPSEEPDSMSGARMLAKAHAEAIEADALSIEERCVSAVVEKLKDPHVVHVNMLRGTIAKIGMRELAHAHGEEMSARWRAFEEWEASQKGGK